MRVKFTKLDEKAITPTYGTKYSAGLDLSSISDDTIAAGETKKIKTGIAIEIPEGYFGAIFARSGLSTKKGLRPANCVGVIDSDYRGEIIVPLHNDSCEDREIHKGDKVAQLLIIPYIQAELDKVQRLTETERGTGGFGSTDKFIDGMEAYI